MKLSLIVYREDKTFKFDDVTAACISYDIRQRDRDLNRESD